MFEEQNIYPILKYDIFRRNTLYITISGFIISHITSSLFECLRNNNAKPLLPKQPLSTTIIFILNFSAALQGRCRFRFAWKFLTCRHRLHIGCSRQLTTLQIPREDVSVIAI